MLAKIETIHVPLYVDQDGVIRIGETRIPLDSVVSAFQQGATPEEIVSRYPALSLKDVYIVVSYYLEHRDLVQSYLERRRLEGDRLQQMMESQFDPAGIRARLLARKQKSDT